MPYEFRILGPVAVARDGFSARLGSRKRAAMVTALLLDANRPVPLVSLAEAMWSGSPPRSAVANVRTHVSALRGVLGERLVARPQAYELQVEAGELDAAEFARLARAGRDALTGGEPATAVARLGSALALWRGAAGDGVAGGTSLDARLVALDEQRLDVLAEHIEARLRTRAYPEIATELRRLLALWPVRERFWELLIRALYRSGNAAGALTAYGEARAALRDQLGMEPGPGLRRLHRAVLSRDPSLETDPAPAGVRAAVIPRPRRPPEPAAAPAPRQLPPAGVELVGREYELATLLALLRQEHGTVLVTGRAGVGKSALAGHAARQVAAEFPDGQIAVGGTGGGLGGPAEVLAAVLAGLGVAPDALPPAAERAGRYRATVNGRRLLILVDGVTDAAQLRALATSAGGVTVLATCRRRPAGLDGARVVEIGPLREDDGMRLLAAVAGAVRTGRDPERVRELARLCDGLPLALRIVGERLARRPGLSPALLARHLARRPLDGLRLGELSVRDAMAEDYREVVAEDQVAGRALPLLGRLDPGALATPEEVARELGEDESLVFFALERLVDAWLAESPKPGRYRTTGLTRAFASDLAAAAASPKP